MLILPNDLFDGAKILLFYNMAKNTRGQNVLLKLLNISKKCN